MTNKQIFALALIIMGLFSLSVWGLQYLKSLRPEAGLKVFATPPAEVFVNDTDLGLSPIDKFFRSGEAKVKIGSYETKVHLSQRVYTVIHRDFADFEASSSGDIVTLEPQIAVPPSFTVVSTSPDSVAISLDGSPVGLTPLPPTNIGPGVHSFVFSSPGFIMRDLQATAVPGYKLTISVKLAGSFPNPPIQTSPTQKIQILSTPTGFLRVRSAPSSTAAEIGQILPGNTYPLLLEKPDWYLVGLDIPATSSGWISSQYAKKLP